MPRWNNFMFPDDCESLRESFLKPRDTTPEALCNCRIRTMSAMLGGLVLRAVGAGRSSSGFFYQFTYWSFLSMWGTYTVLSIAHIFNNDLSKKTYVWPAKIDTNTMPYRVCYLAIVIYEWNIISAATIMIGYTCLEYPFSRIDGSFLERAWYIDLLGHLVHYAPISVSLWEY